METRQVREAEHFDHLAQEQGEIWWGSATHAGVERLRRRACLLKARLAEYDQPRVIELGCGTGAFTQPILEEMPDLHIQGIDVSPRCIAIVAERLKGYVNARFMVGDALHLDCRPEEIDAVVGNSVLHHLPIEAAVGEVVRVLKPGGLLWFSEPNMMNPEVFLEKNVRFIGRLTQNSPDETAFFRWRLRRLLRSVGFSRVEVKPFDYLHPLVPASMVRAASGIGKVLERIPLIREFTGSLIVEAVK